MDKHTPGPWHVGDERAVRFDGIQLHCISIGGSGLAIAAVWNGSVGAITKGCWGDANAHLIAAAPELLAALEEAQKYCPVEVQDRARAALDRAKGES